MTPQEKREALRSARIMRAARKHLGWTQTELADHLEVTQGTLSKFEAGILMPSVSQWFSFCKSTGCSPQAYLVGAIDSWVQAEMLHAGEKNAVGFAIRGVWPLLSSALDSAGEKNLRKKMEAVGIDLDLCTNLNYRLPALRFRVLFETLTSVLGITAKTSDRDWATVTALFQQSWIHRPISELSGLSDPIALGSALLSSISSYHSSRSKLLTAEPKSNSLVATLQFDPTVAEAFEDSNPLSRIWCDYLQHGLESAVRANGSPGLKIDLDRGRLSTDGSRTVGVRARIAS